jgi:antitoxin (DNA-binding transcriptional repressor) of toxin-antitoxin stability system
MRSVSLSDAETPLGELVDVLQEGPVLLLREGRPCAALVGLDERFDHEAFSLGRNRRLRRLVDAACGRTRNGRGIPFSQMVEEIERCPAPRKKSPSRARKRST